MITGDDGETWTITAPNAEANMVLRTDEGVAGNIVVFVVEVNDVVTMDLLVGQMPVTDLSPLE